MDSLRQDVLYALRTLGRSMGFAVSAVTVLALGIGVNVGFLHVVNAALFHRLSVQNPESLVTFEPTRFAWPMVEFFREENTVFTHVLAEQVGVRVRVGDDDAERAAFVSPDYFSALGIVPAQGRLLVAADSEAGAPAVAVISHGYWQRRFGGDPTVVGRTVLLNGTSAEIVGVAPSNFTGLSSPRAYERPSVWIPDSLYLQLFPASEASSPFEQRDAQMYAALRPGVELGAANAQLIALAAELERRYPDEITMRPEEAGVGRPLLAVAPGAWVPIALVTTLFMLVLVTACANLGNLLLARGYTRMREIGVRMSLGADASRIVRQLMTENLLLAGLGAIAGLGVGYATARGLLYMVSAPPDLRVVTDWRIVGAACVLAVGTALTFGLAPARQTVRAVAEQLTQYGVARTRRGLVAAQVAASCVLLILAAMLARSFERDFGDDLRFDLDDMVVVDPQIHAQSVAPAIARQELDELTSLLRALPSVRGASAALYAPPRGGPVPVDTRLGTRVSYNSVEPSYFDVLNLPLSSGRMFEPGEDGVAILSETAARRLWPGEDPLGKTISLPRFERDALNPGRMRALGVEPRVVVGIVADMSSEPGDTVEGYLPLAGSELAKAVVVIAADDPQAVLRNARAAASRPGLVPTVWLVSAAIEESRAIDRQATAAVGALGVTAMLLAAVGLFGVIAFAVAQRTRELGIRIALGARAATLLATVLRQYAGAIALGGLGGCLIAFGLGNALRSRIFGLEVADPIAYAAALTVFSAVAIVAVLVPARRALKIDPMVALRYE